MKTLLASIVSVFLLNSCVFDVPFVTKAEIPVDDKLLGRWEAVSKEGNRPPERILVLQYSENEYVAAHTIEDKTMAFRAFAVKLEGAEYMQIQLIGTVDGPVKTEDRKYHLLKWKLDGDRLSLQTIKPDVIGKDHKTTAELLTAFKAHKDDSDLFDEPAAFHRIQ